jgi:hypothetical protein
MAAAPFGSLEAAEAGTPASPAPTSEAKAAEAEKPPPLPLHQIEGNGGGLLNHEANGVWGVTTKFEF